MSLSLAAFRFDVTPPEGHSLCGGWIPPVAGVDDPLEAIGLVLLGAERPIVLCALDWTGLCNEAHLQWRQALAQAAGTTVERVAVQCVHQHDAPFVCLQAQQIVQQHADLPHNVNLEFFQRCLARAGASVQAALKGARPISHIASAESQVQQVTSNRRILGEDGKVQTNRSVSPNSNDVRDLPTGVIDPWLKTVAFYEGDSKVAACHYFAVHPISYCCQEGRVSSEFVGLARRLKQQHDDPACTQIYFTGCAGNLNTGKYNNSAVKANRGVLTQRLYQAMEASHQTLRPEPLKRIRWQTRDLQLPPRADLNAATIEKQIADRSLGVVHRNRPAFTLAWLRRCKQQLPITLSALHLNHVSILHLPGEPFVEYQLRAQALRPQRFIAVAGYGDGGPWYLPTAEAYLQGGYEVRVAFCDPRVDLMLSKAIQELTDVA